MSKANRSKDWNEEWSKFEDLNFFGRIMAKAEIKALKKIFAPTSVFIAKLL